MLDHSVKLCGNARRISKASTAKLVSILNLPSHLARLAGHRLFDDAIYAGDKECITLLEGFLTRRGLSITRHGPLIYAGTSISKKRALEALLKTPWFRYDVLIGIGDSVIDDFLELTSHPVIIGYNAGWLPDLLPALRGGSLVPRVYSALHLSSVGQSGGSELPPS